MRRAALFAALLAPSFPVLAAAADDAGGGSDLMFRAVNLLMLLAVLWWFGRKPIAAFFRERRDGIAREVETAAELRKQAEENYARWQRKLAELDQELESIRQTSRERAERERDSILADARASAERIRNEARAAVEQELRRAREELRREASDLSVALAADLLRGQVTDSDRDRLVDEFISEVESPTNGAGR